MPVKHTRTRKMAHSLPPDPSSNRGDMVRRLMAVDAALRAGRVRVVNPVSSGIFKPRMEIYDNPATSRVFAMLELPGVNIADLAINFKPGHLELSGKRVPRVPAHTRIQQSQAQARDNMDVDNNAEGSTSQDRNPQLFPLHELRYGAFHRTIPLPSGIDSAAVEASMTEGMLTISWPRGTIATGATTTTSAPNPMTNAAEIATSPNSSSTAVVATPDPEPTTVQRPTSSVRGEPGPVRGRSQTQRQRQG
ncbi:hypothetical protein C8F01DRAFT_1153058 [Mycena amicta]|nr:hypothetical protein C8F01DRAFT_1153058 [Mycena amicta]